MLKSKVFFLSLKQFLLKVGQNNFQNTANSTRKIRGDDKLGCSEEKYTCLVNTNDTIHEVTQSK